MKIELTKETRATGEIWYCLYIDGKHQDSFKSEESANEMYEALIENARKVKIETLKSEEI